VRLALDLNLPAETRLLAATRRALAVYLSAFGTPDDIVDDVILAVDEACSNVLTHAFPRGQPGNYMLRADLRPEVIMIEVVDEGMGFDPMARRSAELLGIGGRGLDVMRRLMTTVEVESPTPAGGTRLRMCRQIPPGHG
jgi:sigma-B regulation protein RsbU (phosphoserine phosphatase)